MSQVYSIVNGLIDEARKELFVELMMVEGNVDGQGQQVLAIDWESIVDNPTESQVEQLFLDNEQTKFAVDSLQQLYKQMFKEQRL